ncbi:MAG: efflux RND transporter periplasmic adaptor subunit [Bryobacteraceae bacterium]
MKAAASLAIFGIILTGCGKAPHETQAAAPAPIVQARIVPVSAESITATYETTGTVRARATGAVSARIIGYVRDVKVQLGERVQEGQTLVTLDTREVDILIRRIEAQGEEIRSAIPEAESAIAAARANADLAQSTFNRMQELFNKKSISNQEFDEASARLKAASANVAVAQAKRSQLDAKLKQVSQEISSAEVSRSYSTVTAPFSGVVISKAVEPGNLAQPGAPLFTVEREGALRLEADVEESRLVSIRTGQSVAVMLDGLDRAITGRVAEIVPSVDAASRTGVVKIDLPMTAGLRSGMFGRARFPSGRRQSTAVPVNALVQQGQLQSIFVVEDGTAHRRLVTLGERHGERVEILSGIVNGENIVAPVPAGMADGVKVEVRP